MHGAMHLRCWDNFSMMGSKTLLQVKFPWRNKMVVPSPTSLYPILSPFEISPYLVSYLFSKEKNNSWFPWFSSCSLVSACAVDYIFYKVMLGYFKIIT
jgi:hypothetical protein